MDISLKTLLLKMFYVGKQQYFFYTLAIFCFHLRPSNIYAEPKNKFHDSLALNAIKIDLVSSYFTFFDNRQQLRIGMEYDRKINPKSTISCFLDIGIFDRYKFIKYYDFFNQNQGFYSIEQNVILKGFHLMPNYNHSLLKRKYFTLFAGIEFDINFYQKKISTFNSQTAHLNFQKIYQGTFGIGPSLGTRIYLYRRLFIEPETKIFANAVRKISEKNAQIIKPHHAHWVDIQNNFWWVSNFKIGYAF